MTNLVQAGELQPRQQVRLSGDWAPVLSVIRAEATDCSLRLQLKAPFHAGVGCGDPSAGHVDIGPEDVLVITKEPGPDGEEPELRAHRLAADEVIGVRA